MSEIFRCQRTAETMRAGPTSLARMMHEAEDTDDDVMLLAIVDEVATRERGRRGFESIYRAEYMRLMAERQMRATS